MAFLPRHLIGAALACALILIFPASPAFAHDALKSSSPAKNAQVDSVDEIELEYSASVKFPFVVLHDAAGKEVRSASPCSTGRRCSPTSRSRSRRAPTSSPGVSFRPTGIP